LLTLRLLLIDEYRRVILHDSHLPSELLPIHWVGDTAYALCREIYLAIQLNAENQYRELVFGAGEIALANVGSNYLDRFKE